MFSPDLIKYIKDLSTADKKTLSQKALKTCEEVGELAKVVLPYDGAHGTQHRFVDRGKIVEEVADVMLCALSIAFSLGCDAEEVEAIVAAKAGKWAGIQARENRCLTNNSFAMPFELHVTVQTEDVDCFRQICAALGCKAISLGLTRSESSVMRDVMTETRFFGSNRDALDKLKEIASALRRAGFEVIREKIETVPWHPAAPSRANSLVMPASGYFEAHFPLDVPVETKQTVVKLCEAIGLAVAENRLKSTHETERLIVTQRSYEGTSESFSEAVEKTKSLMFEAGLSLGAEQVEFAVYDTNVKHDEKWLASL